MNDYAQKFFLPWNDYFIEAKDYTIISNNNKQHLYKKDSFGMVSVENIKWWNKPYFAILNEKSTVQFFIDAIMKKSIDEAKVYLSKTCNNELNIDEISNIFTDVCKYKYISKIEFDAIRNTNVSVVSITPKYVGNKKFTGIINVKMVQEPNRYGNWKIYKIEEEN